MTPMEAHVSRLVLTATIFGFVCGATFMLAWVLSA